MRLDFLCAASNTSTAVCYKPMLSNNNTGLVGAGEPALIL